ncbi:MAG: hypothetical protein ABW188_07105, partial [Rhodococcus fascians]
MAFTIGQAGERSGHPVSGRSGDDVQYISLRRPAPAVASGPVLSASAKDRACADRVGEICAYVGIRLLAPGGAGAGTGVDPG